ncbi:hypothetical protein V8E36_003615 [Tilletia maclaganii]
MQPERCDALMRRHIMASWLMRSRRSIGQAEKAFHSEYHLKSHQATQFTIKHIAYDVEGCDKTFYSKSDRKKHKAAHFPVNPFPGNVEGCDKAYSRLESLQQHMVAHSHLE